ncbi:MAG: amidohydrolase [Terricaulis sp.]|nr:amidohydrolase [Terricaulis sp.]
MRQAGAADLLAKAGPGRLLWGSDAPYVGKETETSYQDTLDIFREIVPSAAQRRAISDAALRFYFF